jgi:hypothetical protein
MPDAANEHIAGYEYIAASQRSRPQLVTKLLTFNVKDFDCFPEISVYSPQEILTGKLN